MVILLACISAAASLILSASASDSIGLLSKTVCNATFMELRFSPDSDFARHTFEHSQSFALVLLAKNSHLYPNCHQLVSKDVLNIRFTFKDCGVHIVTILLAHGVEAQTLSLNLQIQYPALLNPTYFAQFDVRCYYRHSINSTGNATINGGHPHPGNHTGFVNGTNVDLIVDRYANFQGSGVAWNGGSDMTDAKIGDQLAVGIKFDQINQDDYKNFNPYYCFFSQSSDPADDGSALAFIDYSCPDKSINSFDNIVQNWTVDPSNYTRYLVPFLGFQYVDHPELYIHCVVNLCIDAECEKSIRNCSGVLWINSSLYTSHSPDPMLAGYQQLTYYLASNPKNTYAIKSASVAFTKKGDATSMYIIVGVVAGIFILSTVILVALLIGRKKGVNRRRNVVNSAKTFKIPRARVDFDRSSLTSSRNGF